VHPAILTAFSSFVSRIYFTNVEYSLCPVIFMINKGSIPDRLLLKPRGIERDSSTRKKAKTMKDALSLAGGAG
jgi:hypothetical protein